MYLIEISSRLISFCHSESEGPMFAFCQVDREAQAAGNGNWDRDQGERICAAPISHHAGSSRVFRAAHLSSAKSSEWL